MLDGWIRSVQRLLAITIKITWHLSSSNMTWQPALHKTLIPKRNAVVMAGIIWPVSTMGKPGIMTLLKCINLILYPLGKVTMT